MCAKKITYRPSPTALLNPRCDPSFKAMFTQETEESNAALQDFISVLIGREVRKIALVPNEPPVDSLNEMQMTFDVSVTFDDGERADIEMQSRSQNYDYAARAEIQAARLLNMNSHRGDNWTSRSVYQISVLNFQFDKDDNQPLAWYTMTDQKGGHLAGKINVLFFDLVKIHKLVGTSPEKLTRLEKWGLFLSYAENPKYQDYIKNLVESEEGLMKASNALNMVSQDDINWAIQNSIFKAKRDYNSNMQYAQKIGLEKGLKEGLKKGMKQGIREGKKEGMKEGMKEGRNEEKLQVAKNALSMNLGTIEQISELTGLPVDVIKNLASSKL